MILSIDPGESAGFAVLSEGRIVACSQLSPAPKKRAEIWGVHVLELFARFRISRVGIEAPCYAAIVRRLVDRGLLRPGMTVWEPHAGTGSFVRPLLAAKLTVYASDLVLVPAAIPVGIHSCAEHDARLGWPVEWRGERPDWIIGNPPFGEAEQHVRALLPVARYGVAFVTRQSFASTAKRADLTAKVWQVWPIAPRPSFTGGATDAAEYNVLLWTDGRERAERPLDPLLGWR